MKNSKNAKAEPQQKNQIMTSNKMIDFVYSRLLSRRNNLLVNGECVPNSLLKSLRACREAVGIPTSGIIVVVLMLYALSGFGQQSIYGARVSGSIDWTNSTLAFNLSEIPGLADRFSLEEFTLDVEIPGFGTRTINFQGLSIDLDKDIVLKMQKADLNFMNRFVFPMGGISFSRYKGLLAGQNPVTEHIVQGKIFSKANLAATGAKFATQNAKNQAWQLELEVRPTDLFFILSDNKDGKVHFGKDDTWSFNGGISFGFVFGKDGSYRLSLENANIDIQGFIEDHLRSQGFDIPFTNERVGIPEEVLLAAADVGVSYVKERVGLNIFGDQLLSGYSGSLHGELERKRISIRAEYSYERKRNFLTPAVVSEVTKSNYKSPYLHSRKFSLSLAYRFFDGTKSKKTKTKSLLEEDISSKYP